MISKSCTRSQLPASAPIGETQTCPAWCGSQHRSLKPHKSAIKLWQRRDMTTANLRTSANKSDLSVIVLLFLLVPGAGLLLTPFHKSCCRRRYLIKAGLDSGEARAEVHEVRLSADVLGQHDFERAKLHQLHVLQSKHVNLCTFVICGWVILPTNGPGPTASSGALSARLRV